MQYLSFTVDSALLRELGEKLVETVHIALIELVKNSFDADATQVEVIFTKTAGGESQIKIIDNGIGMNFSTVENYWMRIATTNKSENDLSRVFGRPLTGAKGIGRFSCRRLGAHLKLITIGTKEGHKVGTQSNAQRTEVEFPWTKFAPGKDVTEIKCPGKQIQSRNVETGTSLIISDISEEWMNQGFGVLKRQLAVLAANTGAKRPGYKDDPGFSIKLTTPDFQGKVLDLRDNIIEAGWGTLTAYINSDKKAVCKLNALGFREDKEVISKVSFPALKDVSLRVAIIVEDKSQVRDTTVLSISNIKQILPEWGGVQVRYKGFRVFPYGDDDWLDINHDRGLRKGAPKDELFSFAQSLKGVDAGRSLLNQLGMRNYVGNVQIGRKATGFDMKLNREGFMESEAVKQLKDFVRFAIDWSTILRDYYIRRQAHTDSEIAKTHFEEIIGENIDSGKVVSAAVDYIRREVKSLSRMLPTPQRREIEQSFFKATEAIAKRSDNAQAELSHLRLIASTSTLLLIFSHEVKSLLGLLEDSKNSLKMLLSSLPQKQRNTVNAISESFVELKDRLDELLQLTSLVGSDYRKAKSGSVALKERIIRVEKVFALVTKKYSIEIDHSEVPNNIVIRKILEAELYSILLNAFSNSIKAVIAGGKKRIIKISASKQENGNVILIRDTGIGLHPSKFEEVFIPFISDPQGNLYNALEKRINPEDGLIVGTGSGLGLSIAKEIVQAHGGKIRFRKPNGGWSTELEITLS